MSTQPIPPLKQPISTLKEVKQKMSHNMKKIIKIRNGVTRNPMWRMAEPLDMEILEGEQIAIVGENGSGKSRLVEILTGHYPLLGDAIHYNFSPSPMRLVSENMKYIAFRDSYGDQDATYYYQQRWNQHDIDEGTPTMGMLLEESFRKADESVGHGLDEAQRETLCASMHEKREVLLSLFHLRDLYDKYIISLSSGELRKFQLARALGCAPRMLVMDNPFVGLDINTRKQLRDLLSSLASDFGLQVILIVSRDSDIPDFITHVLPVAGCRLMPKTTREEYMRHASPPAPHCLPVERTEWILHLPGRAQDTESSCPEQRREILKFDGVSIGYGNRTILKNLHWTVHEGERWALSGENGAGKSTLLSLVCADNPQGYACPIELFGHKRGSGESIWEIKRHIGYVSPEMHRGYMRDMAALSIVASGLHDTVGLYTRPRPEETGVCLGWMRVFGIESLADRSFLKLSSGEQRLCLLARAFVKDPDLLILDEPLHGLDEPRRVLVRQVIDAFCQRPHKTLVMVTHYQEELPDCIDHSLRLQKH